MGKVILIDPDQACGEVIHDVAWRCSDGTTAHICHRAASHISATDGDSRMHKCSLCKYMWPDDAGGERGMGKRELRLCDECRQPCIKDDFMGMKVWICEGCQEIYDVEPRRPRKEKGQMICPIQAHYRKHEAEGKCSYGYCTAHCDEYHSHMPNHRPDKPLGPDPKPRETTALAPTEPEKPTAPDPQPLQPITLFDRPSDIDWR